MGPAAGFCSNKKIKKVSSTRARAIVINGWHCSQKLLPQLDYNVYFRWKETDTTNKYSKKSVHGEIFAKNLQFPACWEQSSADMNAMLPSVRFCEL